MIYGMNGECNLLDDFSSIKYAEKVVHLALPVTFVSNENIGVIEILDSWIRQYKSQLEGILVSYSNVSLLSHQNKIVGDKFCLLVDVKAKFKLFCPNIGDIVVGKINRISKEHIGCLMHDTINVVIKLNEYFPDELHKFMRLERDILFEISHFGCRRKEIVVKGKITPHCLKLMNELIPVTEEDEVTSFSFHNQSKITRYDFDDIDDSSSIYNSESVTSADHLLDNITANDSSPVLDIKLENPIVNFPTVKTKKSKKRKRDSTNDVPDNVTFNDTSPIPDIKPSAPLTNLSTILTKKSKKHKRDSINYLPDNVGVNDTSPISDIKPSDLSTNLPTIQTKKSKKSKRDSAIHLPSKTALNDMSPIPNINPSDPSINLPTVQMKNSKKRKRDSSEADEALPKKRKKEDKKKSKGKKDKKLSTKKIGIVPSGKALKNQKKLKKKKSKKSDKRKDKKKSRKKHSKDKSKIDVVNNKLKIKSEF